MLPHLSRQELSPVGDGTATAQGLCAPVPRRLYLSGEALLVHGGLLVRVELLSGVYVW